MLRGVLIIVLGACGFQSGQPISPPIDAPAGPPIDAELPPDAPPDARPRPVIPPLCEPNDALMACYRFESNYDDESANKLVPRTVMEATTADGKFGMALVVNPMSTLTIEDTAVFDVEKLTIEAWVKLTTMPMPSKRAPVIDVDGQYSLSIDHDGKVTCVLSGGVTLSGGTFVRKDEWTHLACTYDSGTGALYINGVLGLTQAGGTKLHVTGTTGMSIGVDNAGDMRSHLIGAIDELRLMSIARTPTDICIAADLEICPVPDSALH